MGHTLAFFGEEHRPIGLGRHQAVAHESLDRLGDGHLAHTEAGGKVNGAGFAVLVGERLDELDVVFGGLAAVVLADAAEALGGADEPIVARRAAGILADMLWAQAGASCVVWVVAGLLLARSAAARWMPVLGRGALGALGPGSLLAGLVVLVGGLAAAWATGGVRDGVLLPLPWLLATVTGVAFTACQTFGALCLLAASRPVRPTETPAAVQASEPPENR